MVNSVSSVNSNTITFGKQNYVPNPPENFYKFSVYDELKLDKDMYTQFLKSLKEPPPGYKKIKRKQKYGKILTTILLVGAGILAYRNRASVLQLGTKIVDFVKNLRKPAP